MYTLNTEFPRRGLHTRLCIDRDEVLWCWYLLFLMETAHAQQYIRMDLGTAYHVPPLKGSTFPPEEEEQ